MYLLQMVHHIGQCTLPFARSSRTGTTIGSKKCFVLSFYKNSPVFTSFLVLDFVLMIEVLAASGTVELARETDSVGDFLQTKIANIR